MNKSQLLKRYEFNVFCGVEDGSTYELLVHACANEGYTAECTSMMLHDAEISAANNRGIILLG